MTSSDTPKPAAAETASGLQLGDQAAEPISNTDNLQHAVGQLVDRFGHVHSEAIFRNWSVAAIKALGIRRIGEGGAS